MLPNVSYGETSIGLWHFTTQLDNIVEVNLIGKILIIFGLIMIAVGILFIFAGKISWFGKLPGDICLQKKNFSFYFPITTCILLSIIISFIIWLLGKK